MWQGTAADMEEITLGEVKILTSLTHPHIIGYHGRFVQNSCLNILMDYADGWLAVAVVHRTDVVICRWITGASGTGGKGAGSSVGRKGAALTDCLCGVSGTCVQEVMAWACQLVLALQYLHTRPHCVLHRDIKLANVFLEGRMCVKLGDFGLARTLTSESQLAETVMQGT